MTTSISPVNLIGVGLKNLFSIPTNTVTGIGQGVIDGVAARQAGALATKLPTSGLGSIGATIFNFLRNAVGSLFAGGLNGIAKADVGKVITDLVKNGNFKGISNAMSTMGGKGMLLMGGYGILAGAAVVMGTQLFFSGWNKASDLKKGYPLLDDPVHNSTVHTVQALFGLSMAVGGVMAFVPGMAAVGAVAATAGFTGAMFLHGVRYAMGGYGVFKYFKYPGAAKWPFNLLFGMFKNNNAQDYLH